MPPPYDEDPDRTQTLAVWQSYGLQGEWLTDLADRISHRPSADEEVNDILDYVDRWNHYATKERKLGPGWIAAQFKALAAMSPNTDRRFRWMDHAPAASAKGEAWRAYTNDTDPNWILRAQLDDPNSMMNKLNREGG